MARMHRSHAPAASVTPPEIIRARGRVTFDTVKAGQHVTRSELARLGSEYFAEEGKVLRVVTVGGKMNGHKRIIVGGFTQNMPVSLTLHRTGVVAGRLGPHADAADGQSAADYAAIEEGRI